MKVLITILGALAVGGLTTTAASAQAVGTQSWVPNLSGVYRCVNRCAGPGPARVRQIGRRLDLINEAGQPSAGWIDWSGHFWANAWGQGAVYSPDGFTIQFNSGTVWVLLEPTPIPGSRD
jgi:hypothetical protein